MGPGHRQPDGLRLRGDARLLAEPLHDRLHRRRRLAGLAELARSASSTTSATPTSSPAKSSTSARRTGAAWSTSRCAGRTSATRSPARPRPPSPCPSREHGPVRLPEPPADLQAQARRHARAAPRDRRRAQGQGRRGEPGTDGDLAAQVQAWVEANWDTVAHGARVVAAPGRRRLCLPDLAPRTGRLGCVATRRHDGRRRAGAQQGHRARRWAPWRRTLAAPTLLEHATETQRIEAGATDRHGRGGLVPALQRARLRVGPGQCRDTGRARRGRVGRHGPEGVELLGRLGGLRHAAGPDRRRRAQARGHHVLRDRHEAARDRGTAAQADERRVQLLRGLPDGGPSPGRPGHRRGQRGLAGGAVDAVPRAQLRGRRRTAGTGDGPLGIRGRPRPQGGRGARSGPRRWPRPARAPSAPGPCRPS